ncbi:MAG: hypothetical protein WCG75_04760 [Armatimonadota bacterium]
MKLNSITRFTMVGVTVLGTVLIATSQPSIASSKQAGTWPTHKMIPDRVSITQVQEFKDAATLHLNDVQKSLVGRLDASPRAQISRCVFTETIVTNYINKYLVVVGSDMVSSPGGGMPVVKKLSPAQLAMLYYTFDKGIDTMKLSKTSAADDWATKSGIGLNVSPKDMGMTFDQFKQMVATYCEGSPMRFWNEARVGLASGR